MASQAGARTDRSRTGPGRLRLGIAIAVGAALGLFAGAFSFAVVNDVTNPAIARAAYGGLPQSAARIADITLFNAAQRAAGDRAQLDPSISVISGVGLDLPEETRQRVRQLALSSLQMTPLHSPALRQLAFISGDPARQRALLDLGHEITRRDVLATIQRAELHLRDNEVDKGLAGLQQALTVSDRVDGAVFQILLGAASDPRFAPRVAQLLKDDPAWSERMMRHAIDTPQLLAPLTRVLHALPKGSLALAPGNGQLVIEQLAQRGEYDAAYRAYRVFAGRDPDPTRLTEAAYAPLDWKLVDNYDTGSRPFGEGQLEIFADPGRQGEVARLIARLRPGPHALTMRLSESVGTGASLAPVAVCLDQSGEKLIAEGKIPIADGRKRFTFAVPASACRYQLIVLRVEAGNDGAGTLVGPLSLSRLAGGETAAR